MSRHTEDVVEPDLLVRKQGTFKFNDSLPKMPVPSLDSIIGRYMECALPLMMTENQKAAALSGVQKFATTDGPALHKKLLALDAGSSNYIEQFYRETRTDSSTSIYRANTAYLCQPIVGAGDILSAASKIVLGSLHHYAAVRFGKLPGEKTATGQTLDMRQHIWLHCSGRVAREGEVDQITCSIDESRHIIVMCRGVFYKVPVISADGTSLIVDESMLKNKFRAIIDDAPRAVDSPAVGTLTAVDDRRVWEDMRAQLSLTPQNVYNLEAIDDAICMICLDDDVFSNNNPDALLRNVLYGTKNTMNNRWLDKFCWIVTGDGQIGCHAEHSVVDPDTIMSYVNFVGQWCTRFKTVMMPTKIGKEEETKVERLIWTSNEHVESFIDISITKSLERSARCGIQYLEYTNFGETLAQSNNCSADAVMHAAMILTYYGMRRRLPAPHHSIACRRFKHARVMVARNMSEEIGYSVKMYHHLSADKKAERLAAVQTIVKEVQRICLAAANAQTFDRPFLAFKNLCAMFEQPSIMQDHAWSVVSNVDLSTSSCNVPFMQSGVFEPKNDDCFGISYSSSAEKLTFCITHFEAEQAEKFKVLLGGMLDDIKNLFSA